ncbi:sugar porter family MFS transporter [Acinetobacter baumannii]|nr:sugar porter family MFS transporter [Acinetobacter baumannii]
MENINNPDISIIAPKKNMRHKIAVWYSVGLSAVAGLLFGTDIGVISGALPLLHNEFNLTPLLEGWIIGSLMGGAVLGALVAGQVSRNYGRRNALLISAIVFILGTLLCMFSQSVAILIFGRIFLGFSVGIASFAAPLYVSEIAPKEVRGKAISVFEFMISFGILASFFCNWLFSYLESWRAMFGALLVPSILFLVGTLLVPKSPKWLALKGKNEEALEVLKSIRSTEKEAYQELDDIQENINKTGKTNGFKLFLSNKNFRRSVSLGIGLQTIQQLTGINIVLIFAPKLFELSGFVGLQNQLLSTVLLGVVKVVATFIALMIVDKCGRRPMLYCGFFAIALSLGLLAYGIFNTIPIFSLAGLVLFMIGYAFSAGPVIWTLCSEIQPLQGRDFGISCSTLANWGMNMFVGTYFLVAITQFGAGETFTFLAILNLLFIIFFYFFTPETKHVPLEQIEKNLMSGKPLKELGKH